MLMLVMSVYTGVKTVALRLESQRTAKELLVFAIGFAIARYAMVDARSTVVANSACSMLPKSVPDIC